MFIPDSKIGKLIAWVAAFVALIIVIRDYCSIAKTQHEVITNATISGLLIIFLVYSVYREFTISRKEKYANINSHQHRCIHLLRDLQTIILRSQSHSDHSNNISLDTIGSCNSILESLLTEFSSLYSMLTGTLCRTSIKSIYEHDNKLYVYTLARDAKSSDLNSESDMKRYNDHQDALEENEDFNLLYDGFGPNKRCFFCNDLSSRRNYSTSSYKLYGFPTSEISFFDKVISFTKVDKNWPLPYNSTIVWPIQQRETNTLKLDEPECIGFLAVDSESKNVFKRKWDFHIGAEIADALFHPLLLLSPLE